MKTVIRTLLLAPAIATLTGCTFHDIDTFPKWCEQIKGVDLQQKYSQGVLFSVSVNEEAVREDFVKFLNALYVQKVPNRTLRMVWREGKTLHVVNLSNVRVRDREKIINEFKKGISLYNQNQFIDKGGPCLYGTIVSLFDNLTIHSMVTDPRGVQWIDTPTVLSTNLAKL